MKAREAYPCPEGGSSAHARAMPRPPPPPPRSRGAVGLSAGGAAAYCGRRSLHCAGTAPTTAWPLLLDVVGQEGERSVRMVRQYGKCDKIEGSLSAQFPISSSLFSSFSALQRILVI